MNFSGGGEGGRLKSVRVSVLEGPGGLVGSVCGLGWVLGGEGWIGGVKSASAREKVEHIRGVVSVLGEIGNDVWIVCEDLVWDFDRDLDRDLGRGFEVTRGGFENPSFGWLLERGVVLLGSFVGCVLGFVGDVVEEGLRVGLGLNFREGLRGCARGPNRVLGLDEWWKEVAFLGRFVEFPRGLGRVDVRVSSFVEMVGFN